LLPAAYGNGDIPPLAVGPIDHITIKDPDNFLGQVLAL
jgi:hypothetical protein